MNTIDNLPDSEKARLLHEKKQKELHWYVLKVASQHERQLLEAFTGIPDKYMRTEKRRKERALKKLEPPIEAFVAIREQKHKWSDRMRTVPVILIPGMIFVRIRLEDKKRLYLSDFVKSFLFDKDKKEPACISDDIIAEFRKAIEDEVDISMQKPVAGSTVMIQHGPYEGFVGEVIKVRGGNKFQLRLTDSLAVVLTIDLSQIKVVPEGTAREIPDNRF